jgi:hypothetical protein
LPCKPDKSPSFNLKQESFSIDPGIMNGKMEIEMITGLKKSQEVANAGKYPGAI